MAILGANFMIFAKSHKTFIYFSRVGHIENVSLKVLYSISALRGWKRRKKQLIELINLTKTYGDHTAVQALSFKLRNGRIYGLLGPNGAGKSTTMNMMTGCLAPTGGTVRINGYDIYEQPLDAKRFIGYLPEQPPLYPDMTPEEFLTFVAEAKGVAPLQIKRQVEDVMEKTNITDMKDRLIKHLSKGYCQRVGIAQAILGEPEIVILDEPTVGLDPKQIADIRALIRTLGESCTVMISSHILAEIGELCDELLVISHGELVASGTLEELEGMLGESASLQLTVRGDAEGVLAVLDAIEGASDYEQLAPTEEGTVSLRVRVPRDKDVRDDIFFAMAEHRYAVVSMELEQQTLEQVFLTLTEQPSDEVQEASDEGESDNQTEQEEESVQ